MGIFDFFKKASAPQKNNTADVFTDIIDAALSEAKSKNTTYWWSLKANEFSVFNDKVLALADSEKAAFIQKAVLFISAFHRNNKSYSSQDENYQKVNIAEAFMQHLLKTKLTMDDDVLAAIIHCFMTNQKFQHGKSVLYWPVGLLMIQVERQLKLRACGMVLKNALVDLEKSVREEPGYDKKEPLKVLEKISKILFETGNEGNLVKPVYFPAEDKFSAYANGQIRNTPEKEKGDWFRLMSLSAKGNGGKPSAKLLAEGKALYTSLGPEHFKKMVQGWFEFVVNYKEQEIQTKHSYNGREYTNTHYEMLAGINLDMLKVFVWLCVHFHDKATLNSIASLAERSFKKIPGKGPAAAGLGNACLYTLANSKGLDGVAHLSRLKLRIKQSSTQTLIEKYLQEAADKQGVSVHEIEDLAVDDFGLTNGAVQYEIEGFKLVITIVGIGKTKLEFFKPGGDLQKTVPSVIKDKYAAKFKKIKDTAKQIEATLTTQRDRLDRMLKSSRRLTWAQFNDLYFTHGLMEVIVKKLIWVIEEGGVTYEALYTEQGWVNATGELVKVPGDDAILYLWHPVYSNTEEVKDWRQWLITKQIVQPLKQAFRELYLLTDAEINTRTYSNRMAAHVLKQHQFNSLAKLRGWKYSLLGAYDDGRYDERAQIVLSEYHLRAEYWINEVNADDAFNDTGIWLYVTTDQVRFVNTENDAVINLADVPKVVFSEIMRDVDLFVGVASVGNDPTWQDSGGIPAYRDYWQSYSFGDLTEVAKTRKAALERLVPRLKIAGVCEMKDKFLVVKGSLRTYKIHIGSTNILMEPNDQYLCIVPDRSAKSSTESLFIPFEGDNGLSLILSKAFLLAEDDKITDTTITRQIKSK